MADPLMTLPPTAAQRRQAARDKAQAAAPNHPWCAECDKPVDLVMFTAALRPGRMDVSVQCHGAKVTRTVSQRDADYGAIAVFGAEMFGEGGP
jgi:hypothetical protein